MKHFVVGPKVSRVPNFTLFNLEGTPSWIWGFSSAGRAPALQAGGRRFEPDYLHQENKASPRPRRGPVAQLARAYD